MTLKKYIQRWLEENPRLNLPQLADRCDVPYQSLYRYTRNHVALKDEYLINLSMVVCSSDKERTEVYGVEAPHLLKLVNLAPQETIPQFQVKDVLSTKECFIVFCMASKDVGTTKEEITKELGQPGLQELDELLEKEVLSLSASGKITVIKNAKYVALTDHKAVKKAVAYMLDRYNARYKKNDTHLHFLADGIDPVGYKKIYDKIEKLISEIGEIAAEHPGDINLYFGSFMNYLGA